MTASPIDPGAVRFVLCDLDGVVWLRRRPIAGARESIERLRASGRRVLFVTNNSMSPIAEHEAALAAIGVPATGDVLTSAQAAASLVRTGERVVVCGGPGVEEAVRARGATVVAGAPADAVVVGLHQDFDYWRLHVASAAVRQGARFIATNEDATFPTPDGPIPGAGALVAAVATAAGAAPVVAGKPHPPIGALVRSRCGRGFGPTTAIMVGDRWSTDGLFARALGVPFALVRSGVTSPGEVVDGTPAIDVDDLAAVADLVLADRASPTEAPAHDEEQRTRRRPRQ